METEKEILKASDVGRALGVSASRVSQMIRAGELPWVRVGRRGVRIPRKAFEEYIEELNHRARESVQVGKE